jgi:acyl-CoA thioester hydrolase
MTNPLAGFANIVQLPVHWSNQDPLGHVNNVEYLRWAEYGRLAFLADLGLFELYQKKQIAPVLASITCDYRYPVTYPDAVEVGTRIQEVGETSFTLAYRIVSGSKQRVAAEGTAVVVLFDLEKMQKCPIAQELRKVLQKTTT